MSSTRKAPPRKARAAKKQARKRAKVPTIATPRQQAKALVRFHEELAQEHSDLLRQGYGAGLTQIVQAIEAGKPRESVRAFERLLSLVDRAEARGRSEAALSAAGAKGDSSADAAYTLEELTRTYTVRKTGEQ